ncbi:MAG: hypothetical protein QM755_13775 [Luteolibacter sp.]
MFRKIASGLERAHLESVTSKNGLACPVCGTAGHRVPAEVDTVITCRSCGHFGSVSEWGRANLEKMRVGRAGHPPADTRITRSQSGSLTVWEIPPPGRLNFILFFGWLWTAFMCCFSLLLGISMARGHPLQSDDGSTLSWLLWVLFLVVFWAIGLGLLYHGYRMKNTGHRVTIGDGRITLGRHWGGSRKERGLPLAGLQSISQVVFYSQNYQPVHGIEIRARSGKLRFGSVLEPEEKAWLVADFTAAAWPDRMPALNATGSHVSRASHSKEAFHAVLPASPVALSASLFLSLLAAAFLVIGWFVLPHHSSGTGFTGIPDLGFRGVWIGMSGLFLVGGCGWAIASIVRLGSEIHIEGDARRITVRRMKKGVVLKEQFLDRALVRDIRASGMGEAFGKPVMKLELIVGDKVERIAGWVDGDHADQVVDEVRRALG